MTEQEILRDTELAWNRAIADNDVARMTTFMDEAWIIFSGDANITGRREFLAAVTAGDLVHTRMDFEILRVDIHGETGIVMQRGTSAGTWRGQPFSNLEIASTVFSRRSGTWLALQTMLAPVPSPATTTG